MSEEELYYDDEVVDNDYEFNEHGICLNPTWNTFKCSKKYTAVIKLAQCDNGKWIYGWDFQGKDQGFSTGCSLHEPDSRKFDTKKLCLQYAIIQMVKTLEGRGELYQPLINVLLSCINEPIETTKQLTLF